MDHLDKIAPGFVRVAISAHPEKAAAWLLGSLGGEDGLGLTLFI